ncbi:M56 family metallopeptidase [Massilia niastensis]|uniref:M56 family metallopeptidase n=1 Tax=Massilia niastensis TaxID=544911 RepID=UPI00039E4690|nr:M56 family metallopeptidase [Massilia niastensis]
MSAAGVIAALGWTLLHFLWQGVLVGCATAVCLALLRNARAEQRYLVACAGLFLCLAWPALDLVLRLRDGAAATGAAGLFAAQAEAAGTADDGIWTTLLREHLAGIVLCWALCALLLALRMAMGLLWIRRAARDEASDPAWQARLDRLAVRFDLTRTVRLRVVAGLASPVTAGWWRPVVLVPAALVSGMPAHLLEALLAHELAHIRRHDYLVNLAQNLVETLLFYHPAVWWISGQVRQEREHIADDFAARILGEPRRLALALSELERIQFSTHHLAVPANGGDLMFRIKRLVRPDTQALNWKAAIPLLGIAVMSTALFAHAAPAPQTTAEPDTYASVDFPSCKKPVYPHEALKLKQQGTVAFDFLVGTDGKVKDSKVLDSSGHPALDDAALTAISKCSFYPGRKAGLPVQSWAKVKYVWSVD